MSRSRWPFFIVGVHCVLVPIAVLATLQIYGLQNRITVENQRIWTPIVDAQISLLALYWGLGAGGALLRSGLSLVGAVYVLLTSIWGNSMLAKFPDRTVEALLVSLKIGSIEVVLTSAASGAVLLTLRGLIGVGPSRSCNSSHRFRIADLLLTTLLVAAVLAWYRYAWPAMPEYFRIQEVMIWIAFTTIGAVGCFLLLLSTKWWWVGGILMVTSLLLIWKVLNKVTGYDVPSWTNIAYQFTVILVTIAAFRSLGVHLRRG
jgi:hypothetical protein